MSTGTAIVLAVVILAGAGIAVVLLSRAPATAPMPEAPPVAPRAAERASRRTGVGDAIGALIQNAPAIVAGLTAAGASGSGTKGFK